jgi:hypothetical protein
MKLVALAACAMLSASALLASTTFANINYNGTKLVWGSPCDTVGAACPATGLFQYVGGIHNNAPYNGAMDATLTYDWEPDGVAQTGFGGEYYEYLTGEFEFTYGGANLLTVDFHAVDAVLLYQPLTSDLSLYLNTTTTGGVAPIMTSDILTIAPLTDWAMTIDFGNVNPGVLNGYVKGFNSKWDSFTVGASPYPAGQIPEPASMLMAGAGLLSIGGLLSLRKRWHK